MDTSKFKILVVDDEDDVLEFVGYNLRKDGFLVYTAKNGEEGVKKALDVHPHLVILDVMMPEMDGIETCEKIRSLPEISNTMIAFLTARAEDYSQVAGFVAGGDDYITKPIKPKVLVHRIKALLKRHGESRKEKGTHDEGLLELGELVIDKDRHLVVLKDEEIEIPKKEFKLLLLLTSRPSKVFTREEIFDRVWGSDVFVGDRTIDVYIRKLREKLGDDYIKTIKGVGYKFEQQG